MKRTIALLSCGCLLASVALLGVGAAADGEPPLADAGLDQQVPQNATVLLDAAGSRDPDGTIQSYRWTIRTPDGRTVRPADPGAARTAFVARQRGRYEVTVTVWDDDGHLAADTLYVDVGPSSEPSGPDVPDTPAPPSPSDPGPTSQPDTASEPSDPAAAPAAAARSAPATPTCPDGQRYLRAFDRCAGVSGQPPTIAIEGPTVVQPGSEHTYRAEASDFPDGIDRIEWGGGETGSMVLRQFSDEPNRQVTLTATVHDGEGNSRTARHTVYVGAPDPPPSVEVTVPEEGCVDQQVSFEGTATARGSDRIERTWWPGPGPVFTPGDPGVYSRTFKASDDDGQTATDTAQIRITECEAPNIIVNELGGPTETDRILIMGTDTHLQATREVANLTRLSYGEDANRMGGGLIGNLADGAEGIGHVARGAGETLVGQNEKVLARNSVNQSLARRAVRLSQGEYGRVNLDPTESPQELLFEDDRALANPTVVDGLDPDADRYVIVVKQGSRQNIVDRVQNGRKGIERQTAPIESSEDATVGEAPSDSSGWTPLDVADPALETGETVLDRASDAYNEGRTFTDRLLDDGNSPEDMAEIVGDSLGLGSVGETLEQSSTDSESDAGGSESTDETADSGSPDASADDASGSDDGGSSSEDAGGDVVDQVTDVVEDVNPFSDSDGESTEHGDDSGGSSTSSSDTESDPGDDSDSGSDSVSWSLPDSTGGSSSDSGSSGSSSSDDSGSTTIDTGSGSAWDF
jgi:hypothetical protein